MPCSSAVNRPQSFPAQRLHLVGVHADTHDMDSAEFRSVLLGAQQGADWAWRKLYDHLAPLVGGYFRVRRAPDPEDLVGEVFVQLARNIGRFDGDYPQFRSWVFVVAHHRMSNRRRRFSRKPEYPIDDAVDRDSRRAPSAEQEALAGLSAQRILDVVATLTPEQRDVIALRVIADLSLEETARIIDRSVGSVKQLQRRALVQLRKKLEGEAVTQ